MSGQAELRVPAETFERLGCCPRDLTRFRSSRVLVGDGLVLKVGPPDRAAREAFVLRLLASAELMMVPSLIEAGRGWLLFEQIEVVEPPDPAPVRAAALADLARLHDAYGGAAVPHDASLRGVTGRELVALAEQG